jgi:hypothetical protein
MKRKSSRPAGIITTILGVALLTGVVALTTHWGSDGWGIRPLPIRRWGFGRAEHKFAGNPLPFADEYDLGFFAVVVARTPKVSPEVWDAVLGR